jgi:phosphohistidine swiveling domain-containing protein
MKKINPKIWKNSFGWNGASAYPFFTSVWKEIVLPQKKKYFVQWKNFVGYFNEGQWLGYIPKDDFLREGNKIISDLLKGERGFIDEVDRIIRETLKSIDNCKKCIVANEFKNLDKWWIPAVKVQGKIICTTFNFDLAFNDFMEKLQKKNKGEFDVLNAAISPDKPSFIAVANKRLIELNKQFPGEFDKTYNIFMREFGWFQNSYAGIFVITKDWLKDYLVEIQRNYTTVKSAINNDKINSKYALLIKTAKKFFSYRDEKKIILLVCVDLMEKWLKDVCKKFNLNFNEMRWLTIDEVMKAVAGDKKYIERAKEYEKNNERIGILAHEGYNDITKGDWEKIKSIIFKGKSLEVNGVIANKGLARGRVKIVLDVKKDSSKFKKGDVLVASMTRPEYSSLMMMASAFVTDEGGISCHAAIIARELNKPCIIGTQIATKVLKDGDLVEVDAERGIVRIIK